ncbi:MAG TPA: EAL domain-containing protein, partial [Candidatus Sulfotelmatobacter sp.]|nr:EAL domain-containing protein [Candidatus Sulfotelmatobacter sp.]
VKLDASIIQGIDRDPTRQALVVGLHQFARSLGHDVIAEGVETEAELAVLRRLGITLAQGYRLGRPASVAANGSRASGTEPPGEPSRVAPSTRQPTVTTPGGS